MAKRFVALTRKDAGFGFAKTPNALGPSGDHFPRELIAETVSDAPAADNAVWVLDPKGEWEASLARNSAEIAHILRTKPPASPHCPHCALRAAFRNSASSIHLLNLTFEPLT